MILHIKQMLAICGLCVATSGAQELDSPYCALRYRRLCQGKGRHIACQFPNAGPGESCLNYTQIIFTKELRHFVTHYINRRRQKLAAGNERVRGGAHMPQPEVMMQVEWDRELALLAQRLADQCNFVHDDCRATVRYPYAGQTVGEVKWRRSSESEQLSTARAVRRVLDAWWGERRRATVTQLTQPFRLTNKGNVWGHFSQLAVWTLRAVGCGGVRHGVRYPRILLVCDFSHTNMLGQRTLSPGPPAPCPIHTVRRPRSPYPLLCAPVRFVIEKDSQPPNRQQTMYDIGETEYHDDVDDSEELDDTVSIVVNTTTRGTTKITRIDNVDSDKYRANEAYDKDEVNKYDIEDKDGELTHENEQEIPYDNNNNDKYERNQAVNNKSQIKEYLRNHETERYKNRMSERNRGKTADLDTRVTQKQAEKARSRYSVIVNEFDDVNTKRKYYDSDQKVYKGKMSSPRMIQKLEDQLERDRYIAHSAPPSFNTRWKQTKSFTLSTKEWTNVPAGAESDPAKNLLDQFRGTSSAELSAFYEPVRHRWRPTRDRPDRPGAKALLTLATTPSRPRAAKKASTAVMKMDQDDVEQLFRDTGFKPK